MSQPTVPPPTEHVPRPHRSDRFFSWIAGLGIARSDGWIGGVAAGIASRLRIDPLIVRGVLVVAALCGLPMILLYAIGWALLPDPEGRIHLRSLLRGRFEPAQVGILAGLVTGLVSIGAPGWSLFRPLVDPSSSPYDHGITAFGVLSFLFGLTLVTVLLVLIVRAARRTPGEAANEPRTASAVVVSPTASPDGSGAVGGGDAPPAPPTDTGDLETWREQHAAWQEQEQAWRRQQQDAERAARERARQERQEAAAMFAAEAAERRRLRRAAHPRASLASVGAALGLAIVSGAIVWLTAPDPDGVTAALALFTAALVLAVAMIVSGVARRRSGFLAFVATLTLLGATAAGAAAALGDVRLGDASMSNVGGQTSIRQPFGSLYVGLMSTGTESTPLSIRKGNGYTEIFVSQGVVLELTATFGERVSVSANGMQEDGGPVSASTFYPGAPVSDGMRRIRETFASPVDRGGTIDVTVVPMTLEQAEGTVVITYLVPDEEAAE